MSLDPQTTELSTPDAVGLPGDALFRAHRDRALEKHNLIPLTETPTVPAAPVLVVVLNFNGEQVIQACLDSLLKQSYPNFRVLVVDNASTDRSPELIRTFVARYPNVISGLFLNRNTGVAGGRNAAIAHANGAFLAFIDNDATAHPAWLTEMMHEMIERPSLGAISSLVLFSSRPSLVNGAGGFCDNKGVAADKYFAQPLEFVTLEDRADYPMGCGMLLRPELVSTVFPLDDLLPKWFDDVEVGERVTRAGYETGVCKTAFLEHGFHGADDALSDGGWRRALLYEKARIRHIAKYPFQDRLLRQITQEFRSILRDCLQKPREGVVRSLAAIWNLVHLPSAIGVNRRHRSQREARPSASPGNTITRVPFPENHRFRCNPSRDTHEIRFGHLGDTAHFHYGWGAADTIARERCRLAAPLASAFIYGAETLETLHIRARALDTKPESLFITVRCALSGRQLAAAPTQLSGRQWQTIQLPIMPSDNLLEVLLHTSSTKQNALAVSWLALEESDGSSKSN